MAAPISIIDLPVDEVACLVHVLAISHHPSALHAGLGTVL